MARAAPRGFVVAAPGSGSGKTTITLAVIAAFAARGLTVASAKSGPDYIDPRFHEAASGRPCINLDPWAMTPDAVRARAAHAAVGADLLIVEGVMGLFDGAVGGTGSTADLARELNLPVVLVVDASQQSRSIAALVHGFDSFAPDIELAGVIATRIGSDRHEGLIRDALAEVRPPCLGLVRSDPRLKLASRHLGLVQAMEREGLAELIEAAGQVAATAIDLDRLQELSEPVAQALAVKTIPPLGQRIAIAADEAFAFAYPHMMADWRSAGVEVVPFSPLAGECPDADCDAIFLPGGYPELHAGSLASNEATLEAIRSFAGRGGLVYGECGGYMVMGEALIDAEGRRHGMLGLLGHTTSFAERRRTLGYRNLVHDTPLPLPRALRGHEFHYSTLAERGSDAPLFSGTDSTGADIGALGGQRGRVMGSYAHIIDVAPAE